MSNKISQPQDTGKYWLILMYLLSVLYLMTNIQKTIIPGCLFDVLQADFEASPSEITAISSSMMIAYATMQLVIGPLASRFNPFTIAMWGTPLLCVGAILLPCFHSLVPVYFCRVLIAIGSCCVTNSIVLGTVKIFPESHTMKVAIFLLIGYIGNILGSAPALYASKFFGWRSLLETIAVITCMLFMVCYLLLRMRSSSPYLQPPCKSQGEGRFIDFTIYLKVCRNIQNILIYCNNPIAYAIYFCYAVIIGPKFLQDCCGLDAQKTGLVALAIQFIGCISGLIYATINRKLGGNSTALLQKFSAISMLICQTIMTVCLALKCSYSAIFINGFIIISGVANMTAINVALLSKHNPEKLMGAAFSLINFLSFTYVSLFGSLCGLILNCYTPKIVDGMRIYGNNAYLTIFAFFNIISVIVMFLALHIKENPKTKLLENSPSPGE